MKGITSYITEKLKINKDSRDSNNEFISYVLDITGMGRDINDLDIYYGAIRDQLYINHINSKYNLVIKCNSRFDLHKRYDDINLNWTDYDSNIDFVKNLNGIDTPKECIVLNKYPFKIYSIKEGIFIRYQRFNDNYNILIEIK